MLRAVPASEAVTTVVAPGFVERRGPGWFEPSRPLPREKGLAMWQAPFVMRRNLLEVWTRGDYRAKVGEMRFLGRQVVIANTPEAARHILVGGHANYERKSPQLRRALSPILGDGLLVSDGETWRRRKPLVADIVHKNRMKELAPTMAAVAAERVELWLRRPADEPLRLDLAMIEVAADIIARAIFGNRLGAEAVHAINDGMKDYQSAADIFNLGYYLNADDGWPIRRGPRLRRAIALVHGVIDRVITDQLEGRGEHSSMLDLMVRRQARNPELGLDREALRSEAATIFLAGHETAAATMAWTWYVLANAPWAEEAMLAEIDRVCGQTPPTLEQVPDLTWCRAVIEEAMRLYPAVAVLGRQAAAADRIGDIDVDAKSLVFVMPWLLHRSPDLWDDPDRFRPERFLGGARPVPFSYLPFSAGPRICPGMSFALTEQTLTLATLVQRFRVRMAPGHKVVPLSRLTTRPADGLLALVSPRR